MGLDDYHPLTRLKKFSEWYYSETFPVSEFAKWLKNPVEKCTGLCIDMANRGFVFYDRANRKSQSSRKPRIILIPMPVKKIMMLFRFTVRPKLLSTMQYLISRIMD